MLVKTKTLMQFHNALGIQIRFIILFLLSRYNMKKLWTAKFICHLRYAFGIEMDPDVVLILYLYYVLHSCYALNRNTAVIFFFFGHYLMICVDAVC
jgi:hypothetical protein